MKSNCFTIVLSCLLLATISSCTNNSEPGESAKVLSVDSLDSEKQMLDLNNRIAAKPSDAAAYYERAQIFIQKNILQQAFRDLSMATILDSTKPEYFLMLADVSFRGLQIQQAVKAFEKCLELDPKNLSLIHISEPTRPY